MQGPSALSAVSRQRTEPTGWAHPSADSEAIGIDSRAASAEEPLHHAARLRKVELARVLLLERCHHLAHVLDALCAHGGDHLLDRGLGIGIRHLLGQEALDDSDLRLLFLRELGPIALFIELDRLAAL